MKLTMSLPDQISTIERLLQKLSPDILIVSEANTNHVCNWVYPGYTAHRGHLKGEELVRVSALVKTSLKHTVTHLDVEVPNVMINFQISGKQHRCTGVYREWNYGGRAKTPRVDQEERWCAFEDAWCLANRRRKNSCLIGDMNFDFVGNNLNFQTSEKHSIQLSML